MIIRRYPLSSLSSAPLAAWQIQNENLDVTEPFRNHEFHPGEEPERGSTKREFSYNSGDTLMDVVDGVKLMLSCIFLLY